MKRINWFLVSLILILTSCAKATSSGINALIPREDSQVGINLLIESSGEVKIKRTNWNDYYKSDIGAILYPGNLILPSTGSEAVILCSDLSIWSAPNGVPGGLANGCPQRVEPILIHADSSKIGSTRLPSEDINQLPYIISPRATRVLDMTLKIKWNPLSGASKYTVQLRGGDIDWEVDTSANEVEYSDTNLLDPEVWYTIVVTANNGRSSKEEQIAGIGFSPLSRTDRERLNASVGQINSLDISEEAKSLAIAHLYIQFDLRSDAIELLDQLLIEGYSSSVIYRTLGNLYEQVGLFLLAEESFKQSIQFAEKSGDVEDLALAKKALGEIYHSRGFSDVSENMLLEALEIFEMIGESSQSIEIRAMINSDK